MLERQGCRDLCPFVEPLICLGILRLLVITVIVLHRLTKTTKCDLFYFSLSKYLSLPKINLYYCYCLCDRLISLADALDTLGKSSLKLELYAVVNRIGQSGT